MRKSVFALFIVAMVTGCAGPQVERDDTRWPSDKDLVEMHIPTQLPPGTDRTPFFAPVNDPLAPPFKDTKDVLISGYNKQGIPTFAHHQWSCEDLVWGLLHNAPGGGLEIDEMQVYSFPLGTVDRLRRGEMPAEEFSLAIFQKTDGVWHRLDHAQLVRRHHRTHFPQIMTWPLLRNLATASPTYEQAVFYTQSQKIQGTPGPSGSSGPMQPQSQGTTSSLTSYAR